MLNPRAQHGWFYHAGGKDLYNGFLAKHKVIGFPCGNTGMQWGGWFRKEIKTADDLKGLKMRIAGLAGNVVQRVGVVPQQIAPGDIYPALERGAIDAVEYIGPYDDEKLGFSKVAKYYYTPGWQEGGTVFHALVNTRASGRACRRSTRRRSRWRRRRRRPACSRITTPRIPKRCCAWSRPGVHLSMFSPEIIETIYGAAQEHYAGLIASNEAFATIYKSQKEFRDRNYIYHQYADFQYDAMMLQLRRKS